MVKMKYTVMIVIAVLFFVSIFILISPVEICNASENIIYVDDDNTAGPWNGTLSNPYQYIQDGINAANESDTINVYSGTYNENLEIYKTVFLNGYGSGSKTIKGNDIYKHTIEISASGVGFSGFTIKNSVGLSNHKSCIFLSSSIECVITNNIVTNGDSGIYLSGSSSNTVSDNTIEENNAHGLVISTSNSNTIQENAIQNNGNYGIFISFSASSNEIYKNTITGNNGFGLRAVSSNNTIHQNIFSDNIGENAYDSGSNKWSYNFKGNYWNDYDDYDTNGDGIGDNPYLINGGSNQDLHPLGDFLSLNQNPKAYIDSISPNPTTEEKEISFNGHGTDDGTIVEWEWRSSINGKFGSTEDISYSGLSIGTHTIKFRVKDDEDQWSEYAEETIKINSQEVQENQKPTATIIKPDPTTTTTVTSGESIYLHGIGTDYDGTIAEYSWRSSKDGIFNKNSTCTKSDFSVGKHTIYFKVKDNQGKWSNEDSSIITIDTISSPQNEPPTPDTGGPYAGYVNTSISFDASKSSDIDGDDIISYEWDFGDGTSGNGVVTGHTYAFSGNYTIKLTVADNQDKTSTISTYVNIITQSSDQNKDDEKNDNTNTPGFELILAITAMIIILIKKRHA